MVYTVVVCRANALVNRAIICLLVGHRLVLGAQHVAHATTYVIAIVSYFSSSNDKPQQRATVCPVERIHVVIMSHVMRYTSPIPCPPRARARTQVAQVKLVTRAVWQAAEDRAIGEQVGDGPATRVNPWASVVLVIVGWEHGLEFCNGWRLVASAEHQRKVKELRIELISAGKVCFDSNVYGYLRSVHDLVYLSYLIRANRNFLRRWTTFYQIFMPRNECVQIVAIQLESLGTSRCATQSNFAVLCCIRDAFWSYCTVSNTNSLIPPHSTMRVICAYHQIIHTQDILRVVGVGRGLSACVGFVGGRCRAKFYLPFVVCKGVLAGRAALSHLHVAKFAYRLRRRMACIDVVCTALSAARLT